MIPRDDEIDFGGKRYRVRTRSIPQDEPLTVKIEAILEPEPNTPREWWQRAGDVLLTAPIVWTIPGLVLMVLAPMFVIRAWAALSAEAVVSWAQAFLLFAVIQTSNVFGVVWVVLGYRLGSYFRDEEFSRREVEGMTDDDDSA